MDEDEQLQLVLELSKKTFEEEEKRRREGNDDDLIDFESPEDKRRKEKIDQLKKLYDTFTEPGPSTPSFGPSPFLPYASSSTLSRSVPNSAFFAETPPVNYNPFLQTSTPLSAGPNQHQHQPPPTFTRSDSFPAVPPFQGFLDPPPRPPKPPTFRRLDFPPDPSVALLRDVPPPLPPKSHLRLKSSSGNISKSSTSNSSPYEPSTETSLTTETLSSITSNDYSSLYQPITHKYVPYTMINLNSTDLMVADLIDLSDDSHKEAGAPTDEEIRREFDPLYRSDSSLDDSSSSIFFKEQSEMSKNYEVSISPAIRMKRHTKPARTTSENKENSSEQSFNDEIDLQSWTIELEQKAAEENNRKPGKFIRNMDPTSSFFVASSVNYMTTMAESVKIVIFKDSSSLPYTPKSEIAMTCEIVESVEILVARALLLFTSDDLDVILDPAEYGLKIYGRNQFLDKTTTIGQHLYTGQCLLHGADVKLELSRFEPEKRYYDKLSPPWEKMKSIIRYSSTLDKEDLIHSLDGLVLEMRCFERSFETGSTLELSTSSQKVKEDIKTICRMMNSIVPGKLYLQMHRYLASTTNSQLRIHRTEFIMELKNFIEIYCKCTQSDFYVKREKSKKTKREISSNKDHLRIMLSSIHSLPEVWIRSFSEFYVSVDIYYGTQVLDGHSNRIPKTVKFDQFFPRIPLELYVEPKRLTISDLPREARLVISLTGVVSDGASVPTGMSAETTSSTHLLAYTSVPIYDENLMIRQGPLFVPLTILKKEPLVKPFGPYPYIKNERDPILILNFKIWDYDYYFPEVNIDMQCIPQDFSTLDHETQEYLLELIEKEEPSQLQKDDQEIIWQKRLYLTLQPEALPYVLSSQNDWSHKQLSQIYDLLEEWAPLRPEIAMQLLLPQYPDEQVRTYAVQRLSKGSTDFLFHSLPQIIEALRFELSEQSALSQFVFELAIVNLDFTFEIYWQLQQRVDHCAVDDIAYAIRCQTLQQKIVDEHDCKNLRQDIKLQHDLIMELDSIQDELRSRMQDSEHDRVYSFHPKKYQGFSSDNAT